MSKWLLKCVGTGEVRVVKPGNNNVWWETAQAMYNFK